MKLGCIGAFIERTSLFIRGLVVEGRLPEDDHEEGATDKAADLAKLPSRDVRQGI